MEIFESSFSKIRQIPKNRGIGTGPADPTVAGPKYE